jgi:hypothetical protein
MQDLGDRTVSWTRTTASTPMREQHEADGVLGNGEIPLESGIVENEGQ